MTYEGISFNEKHWSGKSLASFIAHEKHHGLSEVKMKEVWEAMQPKKSANVNNSKPTPKVSKA